MYEGVFRIELDPEELMAATGPETSVELWCNDHCDLLHASGPESGAVIANVEARVGIRERIAAGDELLAITDDCLKRTGTDHVETYLARHGCLLIPPLRYAEGAKFCRVLALDAEALTAFYRDLIDEHTVTVESKREIRSVTPDAPLLTVDALLPTLSARQREVLGTAHAMGYYEIPRRTTTEEVAAEVGVGRRTAEEHLRRAENKLADALVDYL